MGLAILNSNENQSPTPTQPSTQPQPSPKFFKCPIKPEHYISSTNQLKTIHIYLRFIYFHLDESGQSQFQFPIPSLTPYSKLDLIFFLSSSYYHLIYQDNEHWICCHIKNFNTHLRANHGQYQACWCLCMIKYFIAVFTTCIIEVCRPYQSKLQQQGQTL